MTGLNEMTRKIGRNNERKKNEWRGERKKWQKKINEEKTNEKERKLILCL